MPALILIPGLLCNENLWHGQIRSLKQVADVSVANITQQSTIQDMANAVLKSAPKRFSLAGFSLGSQVALALMELAPERVDRLALLSATHGGVSPLVEEALHWAIATLTESNFDEYLEQAYPTYVAPARVDDAELKNAFIGMAHAVGVEAGRRQMNALLGITHPFAHLELIRCHTVLIGGGDDRRTPPSAHELLARDIPGASLVIVRESGHFTPLEQPEQVTLALRRWLEV